MVILLFLSFILGNMGLNNNDKKVQVSDSTSKVFINNWLINRSEQLKRNIQIYDSINTPNIKHDLSEKRINGILGNQLNNMNKSNIKLSNKLLDGADGQFDKSTNSILINDNVPNKKDPYFLNKIITHERAHSLKPLPQEATISTLLEKHKVFNDSEESKYLNKSGEIYARLNAFRKKNNINPNRLINKKDLQLWKKELRYDELNTYPDSFLLDLFNIVAINNKKDNIKTIV